MEEFKRELEALINRHCIENGSNTPDFLLAEYLTDCLTAYEKIHAANEKWYGKKLEIGMSQILNDPENQPNQFGITRE